MPGKAGGVRHSGQLESRAQRNPRAASTAGGMVRLGESNVIEPTEFAVMRYGHDAWGRFWPNVDLTGDCWIWMAARSYEGYGQFSIRRGTSMVRAHRAAWEMLVGPIPDGLVIDHRCVNEGCVNPDHLEPVTPQVNAERSRRMRAGQLARLRQSPEWLGQRLQSDPRPQVRAPRYSHAS